MVLAGSPGRPFQMRRLRPVKGDAPDKAPAWKAKKEMESTRHPPGSVMVKLSARRYAPPPAAALECEERPPSALATPVPSAWASLQKKPTGAGTPLVVVAL